MDYLYLGTDGIYDCGLYWNILTEYIIIMDYIGI